MSHGYPPLPAALLASLRASRTTIKPKRRRLKRSRTLKSWTWRAEEFNKNIMDNTESKDLFLGASDIGDFITSDIQIERNKRCIATEQVEFTVFAKYREWNTFADGSGLRTHRFSKERGLLISDEDYSYISYNCHSSTVEISAHGDKEFVQYWSERIAESFDVVDNVIEWIYSGDGQSIEVPLRNDRLPLEEMYPWLEGESLGSYYDRYIDSDASILLLIGPPGTGKTTFIRGLLQHTKQSAIVTYDPSILAKDYVFAQFIEGDRNVFVIEDADNFLGARTDGNDVMHKFLNVGDGLVTTKNKKLIFSTNLPSIRDIDSALVRPGRCFDIVNFAPLNEEQADILANKLNVKHDHKDNGTYSIADIFNKQVHAPKAPKRSMGFV